MAKNVRLSENEVGTIKTVLHGLADKKQFTAETAIEQLYDSIVEAQDKGYSNAEILKLLSENGLELKETSLKVYMRAAKAKRSKTAPTEPKSVESNHANN